MGICGTYLLHITFSVLKPRSQLKFNDLRNIQKIHKEDKVLLDIAQDENGVKLSVNIIVMIYEMIL